MHPDLVWYAAYGSNMHAARLGCYLTGGRPPGGRRAYPGCRNPRPPLCSAPVTLPGGVYFALESAAWTGGMAFYDERLPGVAAGRAYLLTAGQFADLADQEMYRPPAGDRPDLAAEVVRAGRLRLGPGRYETLIHCGYRDGHPVLTFTAPWHAGDVTPNPPAPAYLAMIAGGLHEAHGWAVDQVAAYLRDRPGVAGRWTAQEVAEVVAGVSRRWCRGDTGRGVESPVSGTSPTGPAVGRPAWPPAWT